MSPQPLQPTHGLQFFLCKSFCSPSAGPATDSRSAISGESHLVKDAYLVVLHKDAHHKHDEHLSWVQSAHAQDAVNNFAQDLAGLRHQYDLGNLKGYAGHFSASVLEQIRSRPEVAYVERDSIVWASEIEKGAPWGLARISHRKPLSFGTFNKYEVRSC